MPVHSLYLDKLNFRTFPYYTVEIIGEADTIGYMLGLTAENIGNYSSKIKFCHPKTLEIVEYKAPLPADFVHLINGYNYLKKY